MKFSPWFLTAVIAACSVASPFLTAWINNRYALKMRKIDLNESIYKEKISTIRDKYIDYLSTGSVAFYSLNGSKINDFNSSFGNIVGLVPNDISIKMIEINNLVQAKKYSEAAKIFNNLIPNIRIQIQSLIPK